MNEKQLLELTATNLKMVYKNLQHFAMLSQDQSEQAIYHEAYVKVEKMWEIIQKHSVKHMS